MNNKKILDDLYLENRGRLALYIKSKIYSKEQSDVEDCVQETFVKAVEKSLTTDLAEHPELESWLFRIAKNVLMKFNTAYMKSKEHIDIETDMSQIPDNNNSINQLIEDIAFAEIDIEKLRAKLFEILTESEKELFDLKRDGRTTKAISVMLHKSEDSIKAKYKRIRQKLKERLKKVTHL